MKGLAKYLKEIYINCKIPFEVFVDNNLIYEANPEFFKENLLESRFSIGLHDISLLIPSKYKNSLDLLEFCIKDKCRENNNDSQKIFSDLLDNVHVSKERIEECMPVLEGETFIIVVSLNEKINEALEIVESIYSGTEVQVILKNDVVILLGHFENINEHISSISETLYTSIYEKCYISYSYVLSYEAIKITYEHIICKIKLAKKYNVKKMILDENSLIFETYIDGLKEETICKIIDNFKDSFAKLDNDLIQTIDIFFQLDLNLSEASKKLYVHRNTLIYRLDKIEKYTSYDIRKFNDAIIFKIAFFLWKQKNNI